MGAGTGDGGDAATFLGSDDATGTTRRRCPALAPSAKARPKGDTRSGLTMPMPPELSSLLEALRPYLRAPGPLVVFLALWIVLARLVPGGRLVRLAGGFLLAMLCVVIALRFTGGLGPGFQ